MMVRCLLLSVGACQEERERKATPICWHTRPVGSTNNHIAELRQEHHGLFAENFNSKPPKFAAPCIP